MMLKKFFSKVNEEFLDDLFEAAKTPKKTEKKPAKKPTQDGKPKPVGTTGAVGSSGKAGKAGKDQVVAQAISQEQKERWEKWSAGEQNYVIKRSPNGVYATAEEKGEIKLKDRDAKPEKHDEDDTVDKNGENIDIHGEHAKLIGDKDFTALMQSNAKDDVKAAHFDTKLNSMKDPEKKKAFLDKLYASYGKKGMPKWAEDVYKKHHKVSKSGAQPAPPAETTPKKKEKEKPPSRKEVLTTIASGKADMAVYTDHIKNSAKGNEIIKKLSKGKEIKGIYDDLANSIENLHKLKGDKKKEEAQRIKKDFGLRVGSNGVLNVDKVGEINHDTKKILGGAAIAQGIAKYFEDAGVPLRDEAAERNMTEVLSTASKPNLGMKGVSAKEEKAVAEIFSEGPLAALEDGYKKVFLPTDDDGKVIENKKGKNAAKYLQHSVSNNKALDQTIEDCEKLVAAKKMKPEFVTHLKAHKARMMEFADSNEVPSKAMADKIGESYATLACKLSEVDKDAASTIMKNFAEMALYDTEIANGDECYLPSHGSFPSGDKIKVTRKGTRIEGIQSISIKYGSAGEFGSHGFPGEVSKYSLYHPDPKKRDLIHSKPGSAGYTIGVKDSIIDNKSEFSKVMKDCGGIHKTIKDMDGFHSFLQEYKEETAKIIAKAGALGASEEKREALDRKYSKRMSEFIDKDKLIEIVGEDNARLMLGLPAREGGAQPLSGPNCFMCAVTFSHVLSTSNGLEMLEHNHQEYSNGKYHSETDTYKDGTINLKYWRLGWRPYGSRIQGLNAGFNKNRKWLTTSAEKKAKAQAKKDAAAKAKADAAAERAKQRELARKAKEAEKKAKKKLQTKKKGKQNADYEYPWSKNVDLLVEKYIENYK